MTKCRFCKKTINPRARIYKEYHKDCLLDNYIPILHKESLNDNDIIESVYESFIFKKKELRTNHYNTSSLYDFLN